jgi:hypothetical protein
MCICDEDETRSHVVYRATRGNRIKLPMIWYSSFHHLLERHWRASALSLNYRHVVVSLCRYAVIAFAGCKLPMLRLQSNVNAIARRNVAMLPIFSKTPKLLLILAQYSCHDHEVSSVVCYRSVRASLAKRYRLVLCFLPPSVSCIDAYCTKEGMSCDVMYQRRL